MALDTNVVGALSGTGADVNASRQLKVVTETDAATNPGNVGGLRAFSEVDAGSLVDSGSLMDFGYHGADVARGIRQVERAHVENAHD